MIITNYMKNEHRECDTLFAKTEEAIAEGAWEVADQHFLAFTNETLLHFKKEEEGLFPAFEAQTGMSQGPTQVMRYEHEQVRNLISKMAEALGKKDKDASLSLAESMMILIQQHNMKEEQMLYAMCDRTLPPELKESTLEAMKSMLL
ncbi:MAG: hemerythrin HHE cation-binding protein [Sulfurovum sp.]|nr:MAG: hemerythrin HHE cation-binding protein [Sulfurovum sp.]